MNRGIHDLPFKDYTAIDACSHSRLEDLRRSAAYMKWRIDNPDHDDTPDTLRGQALHALLFEPDSFATRFMLAPSCHATLKSGDRKGEACGGTAKKRGPDGAWYCGAKSHAPEGSIEPTDVRVLSTEVWDAAHRSADAIRLDEVAKPLLDRCPSREKSVLWNHKGLDMKGRPDAFGPTDILDLKSTKDALEDAMPRFLVNCGVVRQLDFYRWGIEANEQGTFATRKAWVVAVMPDPPHEVRVYRIPEALMEDASGVNGMLVKRYAECKASGKYPSGSGSIITAELPRWETAKYEQDVPL